MQPEFPMAVRRLLRFCSVRSIHPASWLHGVVVNLFLSFLSVLESSGTGAECGQILAESGRIPLLGRCGRRNLAAQTNRRPKAKDARTLALLKINFSHK